MESQTVFSARLNSHPYAKLEELLPHKWVPTDR